MQLAFVLYKYFPFGGLQRDFMRIALECQRRGHQIRVYTLIWEGDIPEGFEVLVAPAQTLVFYMGLVGLPTICAELIRHGRAADTPAALVQQGTTPNQRVFTGTLADLPTLVAEHEVHAPTLVIVGEVVQLRDKLAWFEGAQ